MSEEIKKWLFIGLAIIGGSGICYLMFTDFQAYSSLGMGALLAVVFLFGVHYIDTFISRGYNTNEEVKKHPIAVAIKYFADVTLVIAAFAIAIMVFK